MQQSLALEKKKFSPAILKEMDPLSLAMSCYLKATVALTGKTLALEDFAFSTRTEFLPQPNTMGEVVQRIKEHIFLDKGQINITFQDKIL
jgi:hypothetical protein